MSGALVAGYAFAAYATVGLAVAVALAVFGPGRVLPDSPPCTIGARLLIVPGTVILWPLVLARWLRP